MGENLKGSRCLIAKEQKDYLNDLVCFWSGVVAEDDDFEIRWWANEDD